MGRNGQGKTNLVEAIAYLSTFSSHRVAAEQALVRVPPDDSDEVAPGGAVIRVKLVSGEHREFDQGGSGPREQVIELEIVRGRANRARLNRTQVPPRDILGLVRTVVFAPEDLQLVRGDPQVRRRFLDDLATQMHPTLGVVRSDFDRVARQRAALMKQASARVRRGQTPDLSTMDVWDRQFAELSARLTTARRELVDRLRVPAASAYREVSDSPRQLSLVLDASIDRSRVPQNDRSESAEQRNDIEEADQGPSVPKDPQADTLLAALAHVRPREIERGVNLIGAHRDDLMLTLGGLPVKGYASHGEAWSVALALRLASFEVLEDRGEEPILILDDVFAELDAERRLGLARMVSGADQVLVTAAVPEDVPDFLDGHRLRVHTDADHGSTIDTDDHSDGIDVESNRHV